MDNSIFGIRNMGNTCYINSLIHCLRYNKDLKHYLQSDRFKENLKAPRSLIDSFSNIIRQTEDIEPKTVIRPESFIQKFDRDFNEIATNPQDAHEALLFLLDKFHSAISRKVKISKSSQHIDTECSENWKLFFEKDYSEIIRIFYGQSKTSLICSKCNNVSNSFSPMNHLQVDVRGALRDSIRLFFENENVEKRCEKCSTEENIDHTKQTKISISPKYLILQIKRFQWTPQGRLVKIAGRIEIPELIDLSEYYCYQNKTIAYELYGGVIHHGSPTFGHYISYCKNGNEWLQYDDDTVHTLNNPKKLDFLKSNSYILFYKEIN